MYVDSWDLLIECLDILTSISERCTVATKLHASCDIVHGLGGWLRAALKTFVMGVATVLWIGLEVDSNV